MSDIFGRNVPLTPPPKGGVNRHFQAKVAKYWNLHIIETTSSIPTKFCTVIKITKYPSWVVQLPTEQIQDGGRPPSCKDKKSPYIGNGSTNFDQIWHGDAGRSPWSRRPLKIWKSMMVAAAILENRKIAIFWPWFDRFRRNLTRWRSFALALMQTEIPMTTEKSNLKGK